MPVVAALDRVMLRRGCEFGSADVVTAVPGGGAPIESDCTAAGSSAGSRSSGVDLDDGPKGWDKAGTSVKRRELAVKSSAVEMLEVVLEVLGVWEVDRVRSGRGREEESAVVFALVEEELL